MIGVCLMYRSFRHLFALGREAYITSIYTSLDIPFLNLTRFLREPELYVADTEFMYVALLYN